MSKEVLYLGFDVHAENIAVAIAEAGRDSALAEAFDSAYCQTPHRIASSAFVRPRSSRITAISRRRDCLDILTETFEPLYQMGMELS